MYVPFGKFLIICPWIVDVQVVISFPSLSFKINFAPGSGFPVFLSILIIVIFDVDNFTVTVVFNFFSIGFGTATFCWSLFSGSYSYASYTFATAVMVAVIIGHIYLSVGHPASRPSFMGMTKGVVPESYAKEHHGRWYDELKEKNEI